MQRLTTLQLGNDMLKYWLLVLLQQCHYGVILAHILAVAELVEQLICLFIICQELFEEAAQPQLPLDDVIGEHPKVIVSGEGQDILFSSKDVVSGHDDSHLHDLRPAASKVHGKMLFEVSNQLRVPGVVFRLG